MFVADRSGSMSWETPSGELPINLLKQALVESVNQSILEPTKDRQGLVAFNAQITSTTDMLRLQHSNFVATVRGLTANGGTCINPAIERALNSVKQEGSDRSRAILLFSDGEGNQGCNAGDTASSSRTQAIIAEARTANIVIYTVGLKSAGDFDDSYLKALAEGTCGRFVDTTDPDALIGIFIDLVQFIKLGSDPYLFGQRSC